VAIDPPAFGFENRTFICSVVFVDLADYSRRPVAQQAAVKRHLNEMIGRALAHVAESDRLALDTGDGAALCFFGDPEDALFAAAHLREAITTEPGPHDARIRVGINLGPVRLVRDLNGNRNIIGDGINVAQRVMAFAEPNQILVSRSYYEVVSHISHEYAHFFQYAGLHRDKHIREHELYEVHGRAGPSVPTAAAAPARAEPRPFSPEFLSRIAGALARELGPMAQLIVQRASLQTRDPRQFVSAVADNLTGGARERFLANVSDVTASGPPAPGSTVPPEAGTAEGLPPPGPITPELLSALEMRLAHHVGPIARFLVARAAKEAGDASSLADWLARHIDDPAARRSFLAAMEGGDPRRDR
jgi:class 3 adenylate cyclase